MDENQIVQNQDEPKAQPEIKVNSKKSLLRTFVMIFLQISNIAFCVSMGYLLFTYASSVLGVDLSGFFGGEIGMLTLGLSSTVGVFIYFFIAMVAVLIVGLAIGFVSMNNKYYKILKAANDQKLEVVLAPAQTTSSMIGIFIVMCILAFLSITFVMNTMFSLPIIMLMIATVALVIAFGLAIANIIVNRVKYNRLSDIDKTIVKEQSKALAIKREKKERKRRVGKLY